MNKMKSLKLKCSEPSMGILMLAHPDAEVGLGPCGSIYAVTNIPNEIPSSEVIQLANATTFMGSRFTAKFRELGRGQILFPEN